MAKLPAFLRATSLLWAATFLIQGVAGASSLVQPLQEPPPPHQADPTKTEVRQVAGEVDISLQLEAVRARYKLPALGAALFSGDAIIAIGATGVRALGQPEKVTTEDLWHLGSCTKAMTATLIGTMVESGELSWETTLEEGLPYLVKEMHPSYRKVTIRQLLTMTGGVPSDLSFENLWGKLWEKKGSHTDQRRQLATGVLRRPPVHEPGSAMLYSNASLAIAGLIAEDKSKTRWEKLIAEKVFTPLEVKNFGFGAPGSAKLISQPRGHGADDKPVEPGPQGDNPPAIGPAGTVHMAMRDWAKFLMAHVRKGKGEKDILKPATFEELHKPVIDDYAMGWVAVNRPWGGKVLNHNGSNTMWLSVTWLSPEKNFGLLVCTNTAAHNAAAACDEVAQILIEMKNREIHSAPKK